MTKKKKMRPAVWIGIAVGWAALITGAIGQWRACEILTGIWFMFLAYFIIKGKNGR